MTPTAGAWAWAVVLAVAVGVCGIVGAEVRVSGGLVRGVVKKSRSGRDYHAFHAIPYAKPPVDKNRFMPTLPGVEWPGVLDATQPREPCAQAALGIVAGVEDCLNLYVYTPRLPFPGGNVTLPVVVWLHGGSFVVGGAAALDESYLLDRDIVLVIPQYRLGILGFFSTNTGDSPGNMGMMDQTAALRWVHDNVAAFGGNPDQVTLAGDCAGGAAAIYHMMSPKSAGLFHRVLSLSGSPLSPWALSTRMHRFILIMANYIKCPAYDKSLMVQCFQELEQAELLEGAQLVIEARDLLVGNHRLSPSVQQAEHNDEASLFLDQHPLRALTDGNIHKIPVLMGVTRDVGSYLVDMMLYDFLLFRLEEDPEFLDKVLVMLLKECLIPDPASHEEEFVNFYFPGITFDKLEEILPGLAEMLGDIHYKAGILSTANLLSQHVPTRMLRFEYEGGPKLFNLRHPDPTEAPPLPPAVSHGDEMAFLLPDYPVNLTPEQQTVSDALLDIIENYANGRLPREHWPLFTKTLQETLVLGADGSFSSRKFEGPERTQMLDNIHSYHHKSILENMAEEDAAAAAAAAAAHDEL